MRVCVSAESDQAVAQVPASDSTGQAIRLESTGGRSEGERHTNERR